MNTYLVKRIWLFCLILLYPVVSQASDNEVFETICADTKTQCHPIPEAAQEIEDALANSIKDMLTAVATPKLPSETQTVATTETPISSPSENTQKLSVPTSAATFPNPLTSPASTTPISVADNSVQPSVNIPILGTINNKPTTTQPVTGTDSTTVSPPATPTDNATQSPPPINVSTETEEKIAVPTSPIATVSNPVPTTPSQPVNTKPIEPTVIIDDPVKTTDEATCPQTSTITVSCTAGNQLFKNITVAKDTSVSQIRLQGQIINDGFISNGTLEENSLLIGGKITGDFKNLGEMRDIHFVGHSLQNGKLSGNIMSKGELNNVQLAPNTQILGESSETPAILSGNIRGDSQFPAYLENVKVTAKTQIVGVRFGKGVVIDPQAVIELPSLTQSHQVNPQGDISGTVTKFSGGLSIEDPINFVHELTISDLKPVKLRANIIPAPEHVGQRSQLLLVAGVTKLDKYGECEGGNKISYYLSLRSSKQQRSLNLYQEPKVWIPQLVDIQDENEVITEPATVLKEDNLLENEVITGAGCYYFFIGYRLVQNNTIVFDTTPLLLKIILIQNFK